MKVLPCLSFRQPWAWSLFHGKNIENRTYHIRYRGPLLVHAGQGCKQREYEEVSAFIAEMGLTVPPLDQLYRGGIIGAVELYGPILMPRLQNQGWHLAEQFGHPLRNPIELPFRPMRGQLSRWNVTLTAKEEAILSSKGLLAA